MSLSPEPVSFSEPALAPAAAAASSSTATATAPPSSSSSSDPASSKTHRQPHHSRTPSVGGASRGGSGSSSSSNAQRSSSSSSSSSSSRQKPAAGASAADDAGADNLGANVRPPFNWPIKYKNTLPDVPFDPKLLYYQLDPMRSIQYATTSLERQFKFDILTEANLSIPIDLIDPDRYKIPFGQTAQLSAVDQTLLSDEPLSTVMDPKKKARLEAENVAWLRATQYISAEQDKPLEPKENLERRIGVLVQDVITQGLRQDRASQIRAIQETFDHAKRPIITHPNHPNLTAISVQPIFPYPHHLEQLAQISFDSAPANKPIGSKLEDSDFVAMSAGMLKATRPGVMTYFLPASTEVVRKRRRLESGEDQAATLEFASVREYTFQVPKGTTTEDNFVFMEMGGQVLYAPIGRRWNMTRRRARSAKHELEHPEAPRPSGLMLVVDPQYTGRAVRPREDDDLEPEGDRYSSASQPRSRSPRLGGLFGSDSEGEDQQLSLGRDDED